MCPPLCIFISITFRPFKASFVNFCNLQRSNYIVTHCHSVLAENKAINIKISFKNTWLHIIRIAWTKGKGWQHRFSYISSNLLEELLSNFGRRGGEPSHTLCLYILETRLKKFWEVKTSSRLIAWWICLFTLFPSSSSSFYFYYLLLSS